MRRWACLATKRDRAKANRLGVAKATQSVRRLTAEKVGLTVSSRVVFAGWAIYAAAMLWLAATLNIWIDEAYSMRTTSTTLAHTVVSAIKFEQNAPFYFVVLWAWRHVSSSLVWARLLSVSCAAAALAVVAGILRRCFPQLDARWLLLTLALEPIFVWCALNVRMYVLLILLVAILTRIVVVLVADDRRPTANQTLALALVAIAGTYTAYGFGILLAGFACALAVLRRRRALTAYAVAMVPATIAFLPLLLALRRTVSAYAQAYVFHPSFVEVLKSYASTVTLNLIGLDRLLALARMPVHNGMMGIALVAAICAGLTLTRGRLAPGAMVCALAVAASILLLGIVAVAFSVEFFGNYLAFLIPPAFVTIAGLLAAMPLSLRSRSVAIWCAVALSVNATAFAARYRADTNVGDWRRVAAYVERHERPGDPVVLFDAEAELPLRFYYRGPNRLVPIPSQASDVTFDAHDFVLQRARQIDVALQEAGMAGARNLWLVEADACSYGGVTFGCDVLERWVATRYDVAERANFLGVTVRRLSLRRPAKAPL